MTDRTFDRIADDFLSPGPTVLPDRVLDAAFEEVHRTRQRRVLWRAPWRFPTMNSYAKVAVAAVAVIAVGFVGLTFLDPNQGGVGGLPSAAPSPTVAPTATPVPTGTPTPDPTAPPDWSSSRPPAMDTQSATRRPGPPGRRRQPGLPASSTTSTRQPTFSCPGTLGAPSCAGLAAARGPDARGVGGRRLADPHQ